jgi:hypothetical protein
MVREEPLRKLKAATPFSTMLLTRLPPDEGVEGRKEVNLK